LRGKNLFISQKLSIFDPNFGYLANALRYVIVNRKFPSTAPLETALLIPEEEYFTPSEEE